MIKTYKANTNISISVVLQSKKSLHISFTPLSNGSSTFTTDNEEVINAIERHYNFGKLFRLLSVHDESKKKDEEESSDNTSPAEGITINDNEAKEDDEQNDGSPTNNELKKITISDLAAAKDYLADNFGISRTTLRSKKTIIEQAEANGIEFVGLA